MVDRLKAMRAASASDRSEDYLVSEILISLVGKKIKAFLDQLKKKLEGASQIDYTTYKEVRRWKPRNNFTDRRRF